VGWSTKYAPDPSPRDVEWLWIAHVIRTCAAAQPASKRGNGCFRFSSIRFNLPLSLGISNPVMFDYPRDPEGIFIVWSECSPGFLVGKLCPKMSCRSIIRRVTQPDYHLFCPGLLSVKICHWTGRKKDEFRPFQFLRFFWNFLKWGYPKTMGSKY